MYAAFTRSALQTQFAYRTLVWASLFGAVMVVLAKVAIWQSVYGASGPVAGVSLADMITYALIGGSLSTAWPYHPLLNTVERSVRTGDVAVYLLKPISYPLYLFANEWGLLLFRLFAIVLPTIAIAGAIYGMQPPASLFHGAMFVVLWLVGFALLFLMAVACGLCAFWLLTAFTFDWLLASILIIFSGNFLPLWFFPEPWASVIGALPFAFVGYYPTAVYLGKLTAGATWGVLALGIFWAAVLTGLVAFLWSRAERRIVVQGG
jgi:ABC-2 type transport system permease protein